jgi:outer membrane protein, heavy metal efflux system
MKWSGGGFRLPNWFFPLALMMVLLWTVKVSAQVNGNLPPDLKALISEALQANNDIKQMASLKKASKEQIRPAGALEDPMISFTLKDVPTDNWSTNQEDMTQKMFEVSQKFPFPGKRKLRSEVAASQAKADDLTYQDKVNEIRAKVVQAYWNLSLAHTSFDLTNKNKHFWEQVVQVTETRYGVGQGIQADVLQAQVELGNYLDRLLQWQQRQDSIVAELNALRSKPAGTPIPRPQLLRPRPLSAKLETLLNQADGRPQLQALKTLVDKQDKAVDLARKDYYPDLTVGVGYALRQNYYDRKRADMFTSGVSINVPLWYDSKLRPRVREEQARRQAAHDAYQSALNQLNAAIKDRYVKLQRLEQQIKLYDKGVIPQAKQAAAAALSAYQVGSLEFTRLYQNQIAAYDAEMKLQEYLKDAEENWVELEWLVGQELPREFGRKK